MNKFNPFLFFVFSLVLVLFTLISSSIQSNNPVANNQSFLSNQKIQITNIPISTKLLTPTHSTLRIPSGQANLIKVLYVIDGDTFVLTNKQSVRLIGINTPEKSSCYYKQAKQKLESLIESKTVDLVKDVSETDKYGRLLRYVYINGLFVNNEMVKKGFAQVSSFPPDTAYQYLFLGSQLQAHEKKMGLWGKECN